MHVAAMMSDQQGFHVPPVIPEAGPQNQGDPQAGRESVILHKRFTTKWHQSLAPKVTENQDLSDPLKVLAFYASQATISTFLKH
jgi:hypothetical protein